MSAVPRSSAQDARLVPLACACWATAWWLTMHPLDAPSWLSRTAVVTLTWVTLACALAAIAFAGIGGSPPRGGCWRRLARRASGLPNQLALVAAGVAVVAGSVLAHHAQQAPLAALAEAGEQVALVGRVVSDPRPAPFGSGSQWSLKVHSGEGSGVRSALAGTVRITSPTAPAYGAVVALTARLKPPRAGAAEVGRGTAYQVVGRAAPPAPLRWANSARADLMEATRGLAPQSAGLVAGMAIGDTSRLPNDLAEAFKTAGLTHLTAVSGGHFSIVLTLVSNVSAAIRAPKSVRVVLVALLAAGFVVLVRPDPSVLRAAAMCVVTMLGLLLGRRAATIPSLCACIAVAMIVDPWLARSYGFALSCAATAGLTTLSNPLTMRLAPWLGRPLAFLIAVPLAAQLCCAPILALFSPGVQTTSVLANVLAAPAVTPATVLGLTAALGGGAPRPVTHAVLRFAELPVNWIAGVARFCAALPFASLSPPWAREAGPRAAAVAAAISISALWLVLRRPPGPGWPLAWSEPPKRLVKAARRDSWAIRRRCRAGVPTRRDLRWLSAFVAVALALLAFVSFRISGRRLTAGPIPSDWQAVACDVGQGDAFVVRTGPAAALLIDTGPDQWGVDQCLEALGVQTIDLLVLTHDHADHTGGVSGAVAGRSVAAVLAPFDPHLSAPRLNWSDQGAQSNPAPAAPSGTITGGDWSVEWHLLNPVGRFGDDLNNNSLALALRSTGPGGSVRIVALGDLEEAGQQQLLADLRQEVDPTGARTGGVDLLKVAHHGSASQSLGLARWLAPRLAVVSSGAGNSYGHPAPNTLDLYRSVGAQVVRTDECGTAAFVLRSGALVPICAG